MAAGGTATRPTAKQDVKDKLASHQHRTNSSQLHITSANVAVMVGTLNTVCQAKQPKLDSSLDYDVIIVGAGQVSYLVLLEHVS